MFNPTASVRPLFILVAIAAGSASLTSQEPQFRAGTTTVPVYATVRNPGHGFVLDLTKDDFEIRDDGRLQPITQFAIDVRPLSALVLIDGSGSMLPEFNRAIEGASSFVLRMLPADRACIGSFADRVAFGPFTSDRDELLAYLRNEFNLRMGFETHLWRAIAEGTRVLAEERGKRVIVVLSDGYNFVLPPGLAQVSAPPPGPGRGRPPIGGGPGGSPIGLGGRNPMGGTTPSGPQTGSTGPSLGDPARNGVPADVARLDALATDAIVFAVSMWVRSGKSAARPNHELEQLAVDTGGAFYQVREGGDMHAPFADIMQQLRQQYVLGFTPKELDGKRHKIEVRVKRPGVEVKARASYVAVADAKEPPGKTRK